MALLQHPKFLVDSVLEALLREDIGKAFSVRGVNKYFKEKIEHELITNTPLSRMLHYHVHASVRAWIKREHNAIAFLTYRTENRPGRPDSGKQLPKFLHTILHHLMSFAPAGVDKAAVRKRYQADLLRVLASELGAFATRTYQEKTYESSFNLHAMKYMDDGFLDVTDLMIAAAAVGDLPTFKKLTAKPESVLGRGIMGEAWNAAAVSGQAEIVRYLLEQLKLDIPRLQNAVTHHTWDRNPWMPKEVFGAFHTSVSLQKTVVAKLLAEFLVEHKHFSQNDELWSATAFPMSCGSFEVFKYLQESIPDILKQQNYGEYYDEGFTAACKNGHADFVTSFLQGNYAMPERYMGGYCTIWHNYDGWDNFTVDDPVLVAAQYSRFSVLEALIKHDATLINHEGLLDIAAIGFTAYSFEEYKEHGAGNWNEYKHRDSNYGVVQWLIDHGIAIDDSTIDFTNWLAKIFMAQRKPTGNMAMTLLLLLATLKTRFNSSKLRKKLHVPVKKAIWRIIDAQPEMRPLRSPHHDYPSLARSLRLWLDKRR